MRKFLSLMIAMMLMVSTASATTIYCKMDKAWWTQDGAAVAVHYWGGASSTTWPGVRMSSVTGVEGLWSYDVPADVTGLMFVRVNGSGDIADWGAKTANLTLPTDGKNLYTITNESATWGDPGCTGEWSTYTPATTGGEEEDTYAYVKVTSAPTSWDGEYLIVYEGDSVAFNSSLANNTTDYVGIGGKYCRFSVKIHNDTIDYHDTIAAKHFTIAAIEGKTTYSIKSASKLYLGRTSTSNGLDKSSTTVYENSISYNEGNFVDIVSSAGLYMRYNKNSNEQRFRFFKADTYTAQQAIQLYKKVKIEATSGEDPVTPPTPAAKDSIYFVNVAGWETPVVHLWGGTAAGTSWPGVAMIKLADQINNYDVYKYVADAGAYAHCIFSNNGANQTVDLDWTSGKYFYNGAWYTLEEIPAPVAPAKYYITGDSALVGAELKWHPDAIKVMEDEYVFENLAAGDYKLKVTVDGDWATAKGYSDLTVKAEGLSTDNDNNVIFTLAEAGNVTVVYNDSVFTVSGSFYVAPVVAPAKYYITGDSALVGAELKWHPDAIKVMEDEYVFENLAAGDYKLKVTVNGDWSTGKGYSDLTVKAEGLSTDNDNNVIFTLAEAGNVTVVYNDSVFTVSGSFYVAPAADPTVAVIGSMTEWQQAIPFVLAEDKQSASFSDTIPAGEYQFKMLINGEYRSNGWWFNRNVLGAANITGNDDANMVLQADVTGLYTFTWYFANDSLAMEFPAAPVVIPAKYYITGDSALVGAELKWHPDAIKVMEDEYVFENLAAGDYKLKVTVNGDWSTGKGYSDLTVKAEGLSTDNDNNVIFTLAEAGNVTVVYNDSVFTVSGNFYVAPVVVPTLEDGYYLVGTMNNWTPAAEYKLAANTENEGEYFLARTFVAEEAFKVVAVANDAITTWYPNEAGDYVVDANHAGATTLYFRPDYQGGEGWYAGCIYVIPTSTVGIEEVIAAGKAAKIVRNGQLFILKGDKIFNIQGQMVK